ncbi:unnamed protein product [marine sediment metagenome]|uniref:Uncharacterized protein n=1 Tax=marine sediment metagenome TaxID=412755 RepID=X1CBF3_9ZZZZ
MTDICRPVWQEWTPICDAINDIWDHDRYSRGEKRESRQLAKTRCLSARYEDGTGKVHTFCRWESGERPEDPDEFIDLMQLYFKGIVGAGGHIIQT